MADLLTYLFKVNLSLILFCLAYYLILRRLTFYTLNRAFLLAGILFSTIYPLINFKDLFSTRELVIPFDDRSALVNKVIEQHEKIDYQQLLIYGFWAGVIFMAVRMGFRFLSLYRIHKRSVPQRVMSYDVRMLSGNISTFSFWQNIYLNPDQHQEAELAAVLEHEQVHVKQWHTLDILAAELATVFYWFNPGVWYMRNAVKENIEFITDQKILQNGADRKAYQYSMISAVGSLQPSVLMNNFNLTAIKRRIIMMNSRRSGKLHLVRYMFVLPVLVAITTAFTLIRAELKTHPTIKKIMPAASQKIMVKAETLEKQPVVAIRVNKNQIGEQTKNTSPVIKAVTIDRPLRLFMFKTTISTTDSLAVTRIIPEDQPVKGFVTIKATNGELSNEQKRHIEFVRAQGMIAPAPDGKLPAMNEIFIVARKQDEGEISKGALKTLENFKMYIDDKEVSGDEFRRLKTSDTKKVEIRVNEKGERGVYLYTS